MLTVNDKIRLETDASKMGARATLLYDSSEVNGYLVGINQKTLPQIVQNDEITE